MSSAEAAARLQDRRLLNDVHDAYTAVSYHLIWTYVYNHKGWNGNGPQMDVLKAFRYLVPLDLKITLTTTYRPATNQPVSHGGTRIRARHVKLRCLGRGKRVFAQWFGCGRDKSDVWESSADAIGQVGDDQDIWIGAVLAH